MGPRQHGTHSWHLHTVNVFTRPQETWRDNEKKLGDSSEVFEGDEDHPIRRRILVLEDLE